MTLLALERSEVSRTFDDLAPITTQVSTFAF
jgi:hypothetical protein